VVPGRVIEVCKVNREWFVDLGVTTSVAEWSGHAPTAGQERPVLPRAILDTHPPGARLILRWRPLIGSSADRGSS